MRVWNLTPILVVLLAGCATSPALREFATDGCSLFPDGPAAERRDSWCECCLAHDVAYWRGGTGAEREAADAALRDCVRERTGDAQLARLMHAGVRAGGHPAFPVWYRWGYGWRYGRGYEALTPREAAQASGLLAQWRAAHPATQCR